MVRLLVGFDGSSGAAEAIEDLTRAGFPETGLEALIASAAEMWIEAPPPGPPASGSAMAAWRQARDEMFLNEAQRLAAEGSRLLTQRFPGWRVSAEAIADATDWGLIRKAQSWRADLVVVGSSGRTALGRFVFGSVAQSAVLSADCSVRVGRCSADRPVAKGAPVRVVLAWDGSANAAQAARAVSHRRWPPHSEGRLITVLDDRLMEQMIEQNQNLQDTGEVSDELRRSAGDAANELRDAGLVVGEPLILGGNPRRAVLEAAQAWGADCIFLGAKGHSGLAQMLLGSVAWAVASRATCSVEIVRSRLP
jgi:nucleotide-binding universal stress UspA family protein